MPLIRSITRTAMLAGLLLVTKGCTSLLPSRPADLPAPIAACAAELAAIDAAIDAAGVTDGASWRIVGFPYLRTNRFLEARGQDLITRDETLAWLDAMHALDRDARRREILNLPSERLENLIAGNPDVRDREALLRQAVRCSQTLFAHHRLETDLKSRVRDKTHIPDEYQAWRRLVGLYPLAAAPVAWVTDNVFDDFRAWHATAPEDLPRQGRLVTAGPAIPPAASRFDPGALFAAARRDALGILQLTPEDRRLLAAHFAPVVTQDQVGDFDRIGTPVWKDGRLRVDPDRPTVYYYFSYGLIDGRPVLQINYAFWYSRRAGDNAPWFERGPLDGITVRISLDHRARPFMVDLMNNCGCYHFFIPARAAVKAVREIELEVDPLVPGWLPPEIPPRRLGLRVKSGWHQVQHVGVASGGPDWRKYRLAPYEELETLRDADGRARSMFDADGIAYDSPRIEPLIFFSMGIPAVGSMRQRGHHAIRLVGRAYFDDPLLFEKSFEFDRAYFDAPDPGD